MNKKKLISILFALFLCLTFKISIKASETLENNNNDLSNVFIGDETVSKSNTFGGLLFLFSSTKMQEKHEGYIICFFSNLQITSEFKGDIYSFFSDIKINGEFDGIVNIVSSDIKVSEDVKTENVKVKGISIFDLFLSEANMSTYTTYSNKIPGFTLKILIALFNIFACIILFFIKKSFMEQGSVLLKEEPLEVIKNGIVVYFIMLGFILLFTLTVFLLPLAVLFFAILLIMTLIGEVSLGIIIGYLILTYLRMCSKKITFLRLINKIKINSLLCLVIGLLGIETLKLITLIGTTFIILFLPLVTLGMVSTAIINGFFKKIFYDTSFLYEKDENDFNINQIRDIILKDR